MGFAVSIVLLGSFVAVVHQYWEKLTGNEDPEVRRWFRLWTSKGLGGAVFLWVFFNSGILPGLPPLMPQVAAAKGFGARLSALLEVTGAGLFLIGSYWAAVTFAWLIAALSTRVPPEHRRPLAYTSAFWSLLLLPLAGWFIYAAGQWVVGIAVLLWLLPIAHAAVPLLRVEKPLLTYSRAIAKMKFGKFDEAEFEVIRELEKCDDDFEGWLLLAELYANHFNDLVGAGRTIRDLCDQPNVNPSQVAVALHRLADWQLKLGGDPIAARAALEEICRRFPGLHLDRMARQRITQLPATREALLEQRKGRTIRLPTAQTNFDETKLTTEPPLSEQQAEALANQCVEKLKGDPNDVEEREKLARILAERLQQINLATEQIELLIAMPEQPAPQIAKWLSLLAGWQIRYRPDGEMGRHILQRLVREYPNTPEAFEAQQRIYLMDAEQRLRKARAVEAYE